MKLNYLLTCSTCGMPVYSHFDLEDKRTDEAVSLHVMAHFKGEEGDDAECEGGRR